MENGSQGRMLDNAGILSRLSALQFNVASMWPYAITVMMPEGEAEELKIPNQTARRTAKLHRPRLRARPLDFKCFLYMLANMPASLDQRFRRDTRYDAALDTIPELRWYPYVGKHFGKDGMRIMVYAHNVPINPSDYDLKRAAWSLNKAEWADCLDEYTYFEKDYTKTFRAFIKGAVGLQTNYNAASESSVLAKVDSFIEKIAYLNFIQDLVKSDTQTALAEPHQIDLSKRVNRAILRILDITHCICWGKPTYEYVKYMEGFRVISEFSLGKRGFSSCTIDVGEGRLMHCLRTYHASMPFGFHPLSESTHMIFARFLSSHAIVPQPTMTPLASSSP
jgi:hypothetical protein